MEFIIYVFNSVKFFVYIILCATLYMLIDNIIYKFREKQKEKIREEFSKRVLLDLKNIIKSKHIDEDEILYIKSKLRIKKYEDVFNSTIIEFNNKDSSNIAVKSYMEYFDDYIKKLIKNYKSKDEIKKAYTIFLIGEYKQNEKYISDFLKNAANTRSVYLRFNILSAASKIGNYQLFIDILKQISNTEFNLNKKILIDIIDNFKGDIYLLDKQLLTNLDKFSAEIKIIIVNHYSNNNFKLASNIFLEILNTKEENRELKINILNYFEKIPFEKAKFTLISNLNSNEWEFRALSAKALKNYKCNEVINELLNSITDTNWYVRFNSAKSLLNLSDIDFIINAVKEKNDKYAMEILLYSINSMEVEASLEIAAKNIKENKSDKEYTYFY